MLHRAVPTIALIFSLASIALSLVTFSTVNETAARAVYAVSIWTGSAETGATLRYFGVLPIKHCYMSGSTYERMRRFCEPRFISGSDLRTFRRSSSFSCGAVAARYLA